MVRDDLVMPNHGDWSVRLRPYPRAHEAVEEVKDSSSSGEQNW